MLESCFVMTVSCRTRMSPLNFLNGTVPPFNRPLLGFRFTDRLAARILARCKGGTVPQLNAGAGADQKIAVTAVTIILLSRPNFPNSALLLPDSWVFLAGPCPMQFYKCMSWNL